MTSSSARSVGATFVRIGWRMHVPIGCALLAVAVLALLVVSASVGTVEVPPGDAARLIIGHLIPGMPWMHDGSLAPLQDQAVWRFRLPRALLAATAGAGLALAGAIMQAVVRNPLAEPYILGVSSAAGMGAVLVIVLGSAAVAGLTVHTAAFAAAVTASVLVAVLAQKRGTLAPTRMIVAQDPFLFSGTVRANIALARPDASDLLRNAGALREAARRIVAVLDRPRTAPEPDVPCRAGLDPSEGLRFENVTFRYAPGEPPVLDGFGLHVAPGETVALMGPSGAGKSTSARLALRLWDPDTGAVRVGGIDLRDLPDARLRALVGAVPQDARLVSGTLAHNIRLAAPDASDDAVRRAAADAGLPAPAAGLPDGLATVVGDGGAGVSGGQRARVSIARALLADPRVLVLDEPTASLDPDAEAAFGELLARPSRRATLVITHRPGTAAFCDRFVELDPGGGAPAGQ
ncbi:iron chelate uptake ABC transporter family permease subunit [Actinomadura algeriensis]|uniref:ABC-type multidrug transport system ATPase subunit n=1 Tax=Actinomadura algeriensis TaxID=1679523 RepID=A0ABR9K2X4_9ACTN|nr:iron chelate uptake ABC transporter family permease subunit [Actinomadura algeriensis]MBE1536881.1 ABC-type multidrug transport system ATPase subunit [Actinomadura algeriensis]